MTKIKDAVLNKLSKVWQFLTGKCNSKWTFGSNKKHKEIFINEFLWEDSVKAVLFRYCMD